jgi:hypothetical protein
MDAGRGSGDSMSPGSGSQSNGGPGGLQRHGLGGLCGGNCSWCLIGHA